MAYIIRRIILFVVTMAMVSFITFAVFQILPGDPIRTMLGTEADEVQVETLRKELGLTNRFMFNTLSGQKV